MRFVLIAAVLSVVLLFGCIEPSKPYPDAPPAQNNSVSAPNPEKVLGCAETWGTKAGFYYDGINEYYDDSSCSGKCKADEKCKPHPSKNIILKDKSGAGYRPCYVCEAACKEKWQCTDWAISGGECKPDGKQSGTRTRSCTDANACGTATAKPNETEEKAVDCEFPHPRVTLAVDGVPVTAFQEGTSLPLDAVLDGVDDLRLYLPIVVRPSGDFDMGSNYIFYNDPALPQKLKDEVAASPGDFVQVKCESKAKCTAATDWPDKIVTEQKTGSAKIDWTFLWKDKEQEAESFEIMIGAKGCNENWNCGQWGACTNGAQARTCIDVNNCGNDATKPATSRTCQCTENWQCSEWSECQNGAQARSCFEWNNCGTNASKPSLTRACQQACVESWSCGDWGAWGGYGACSESGTQSRSRTRSCTDSNGCGTTSTKPETTQSESQACTYTPTEQKPEYSAHESALGSKISNLDYNGASESRDLSSSGGEWGYRIPNIPSHGTITVCVSGSGALGFFYYPQYHYGFDFTDTTPGCTQVYNKNDWANGVLVHLGDPTPANVNSQITVTH